MKIQSSQKISLVWAEDFGMADHQASLVNPLCGLCQCHFKFPVCGSQVSNIRCSPLCEEFKIW